MSKTTPGFAFTESSPAIAAAREQAGGHFKDFAVGTRVVTNNIPPYEGVVIGSHLVLHCRVIHIQGAGMVHRIDAARCKVVRK